MTKKLLTDIVRDTAGIPATQAGAVVDDLMEAIRRELLESGEFKLPGLANIKVRDRAARVGRNPQTGESMDIPATRRLVIRATGDLQAALTPAPKTRGGARRKAA